MGKRHPNTGAGGADPNASSGGADPDNELDTSNPPDDNSGDGGGDDDDEGDTVSRKSYAKLLGEKKRRDQQFKALQDEVNQMKNGSRTRDEEDAKAKNDYKKLLSLRDEENKSLSGRLAELEAENKKKQDRINSGLKFGAFRNSLGVDLDSKYFSLVDLDDIVIDDDGEIDAQSVRKAAATFAKTYPELMKGKPKALPGDAGARGGGSKLTYEQWKLLPVKEMRARRKDVID